LSYTFIFRKQFYFVVTSLKIIGHGNPDNDSESLCISYFDEYEKLYKIRPSFYCSSAAYIIYILIHESSSALYGEIRHTEYLIRFRETLFRDTIQRPIHSNLFRFSSKVEDISAEMV
jgi:hypothetical protein